METQRRGWLCIVLVDITWTRLHLSAEVLGYSFSSGCKRRSEHGMFGRGLTTLYIILPGARQGRILSNHQSRLWYRQITTPPWNTVNTDFTFLDDRKETTFDNLPKAVSIVCSLTVGGSSSLVWGPYGDCRLRGRGHVCPREQGFSGFWIWRGTRLLWSCAGSCSSPHSGLWQMYEAILEFKV